MQVLYEVQTFGTFLLALNPVIAVCCYSIKGPEWIKVPDSSSTNRKTYRLHCLRPGHDMVLRPSCENIGTTWALTHTHTHFYMLHVFSFKQEQKQEHVTLMMDIKSIWNSSKKLFYLFIYLF